MGTNTAWQEKERGETFPCPILFALGWFFSPTLPLLLSLSFTLCSFISWDERKDRRRQEKWTTRQRQRQRQRLGRKVLRHLFVLFSSFLYTCFLVPRLLRLRRLLLLVSNDSLDSRRNKSHNAKLKLEQQLHQQRVQVTSCDSVWLFFFPPSSHVSASCSHGSHYPSSLFACLLSCLFSTCPRAKQGEQSNEKEKKRRVRRVRSQCPLG